MKLDLKLNLYGKAHLYRTVKLPPGLVPGDGLNLDLSGPKSNGTPEQLRRVILTRITYHETTGRLSAAASPAGDEPAHVSHEAQVTDLVALGWTKEPSKKQPF